MWFHPDYYCHLLIKTIRHCFKALSVLFSCLLASSVAAPAVPMDLHAVAGKEIPRNLLSPASDALASGASLVARQDTCLISRPVAAPSSLNLRRLSIARSASAAQYVALPDVGIQTKGIRAHAYRGGSGISVEFEVGVRDDSIGYEFDMFLPTTRSPTPPSNQFSLLNSLSRAFKGTGLFKVTFCLPDNGEAQVLVGMRRS